MILFHGTNIDFENIDLNKSNRFKDFGQGFYLTDIKQQAIELAQKRALRDGGTPIVQEYEFDESLLSAQLLRIKRLIHLLQNGLSLYTRIAIDRNPYSHMIMTL